MKKFTCDCGNTVYFENYECIKCGKLLGFLPDLITMSAFDKVASRTWRALYPGADIKGYRQCHNYEIENICNWMVPATDENKYCFSCRLTRTIPDLSTPGNKILWFRLEKAKRRLLYNILVFGLPLVGRKEDSEGGLAFDFLEDTVLGNLDSFGKGGKVLTGHSKGVITINISEADPSAREEIRQMMKERYRTLLGHFRHEIAHYYWDHIVWDTPHMDEFRSHFGDERQNYQEAIDRHYRNGPPADWKTSFISAYATMHPWEDWAETWSHYMHIVNTIETAHEWRFGLSGENILHPPSTMKEATAYASFRYIPPFHEIINDWINLTLVMNEFNRSMGMPDPYPFVLSSTVIEKLHFVHDVIRSAVK